MLVMWVCMFCRSLYEVFAIAMKSCVVCVFPFELFIPPTLVLFFCGFLINCRVFWVARSPRRWFFSHFFALAYTLNRMSLVMLYTVFDSIGKLYVNESYYYSSAFCVCVCAEVKASIKQMTTGKKHNTHCGQWLWMSRRKSMCIRWFEVKMSILCSEISFR